MRKSFLLNWVCILTCCGVAHGAAITNDIAGNWKGVLDAGTVKLRVMFKITKTEHGLTATMDSPDQGGRDLPIEQISFKQDKLRLQSSVLQGTFEGVLDKTKSKIVGRWVQNVQSLPLVLERSSTPDFPPEPENLSPADLAGNKQAAEKLAGDWEGRLAFGNADLRLRLHLTTAAGGRAQGTLDSLDQGVSQIPLSMITLKEAAVRFEARGFGAVYEGTLTPSGSSIEGKWKVPDGSSTPLTFRKASPAK